MTTTNGYAQAKELKRQIDDTYYDAQERIEDAIANLEIWMAEHEDKSEARRTWAHVGDLNKIAEALRDITENR